ncbi:MAG: phage head morphogenesis protein [Alteromonadaceae bacterium]|nr:phage head morphogenesis protein [Alteromonadaceae bacterium]|tara:strand:- start:1284 stop:2117 length:834 start_codon:yes stop_codon:yes gene_type:complete
MPDPAWAHPEAIERSYERTLTQYAKRLRKASNELLIPEASRLVDMAQRYRPDALESGEEPNEGTWVDQLNIILTSVAGVALGKRALDAMGSALKRVSAMGIPEFARQVSDHNRRQLNRLVRRKYGERYSRAEPWLDDLLRAWELENLKLIRSIPERYVDDLQGTIIRAIQERQTAPQLREIIRATYDQPVNRARLIANDQIGKLNGRLTQYRQQSIGVEEYVWQGVMDTRERPEHRQRQDKLFKWSDPPYDGHPGQAISCRCWPRAHLPSRDKVKLT